MVTPLAGRYAAVYLANGANNDYSSEAMSEVNLSAYGFARYTVYQITNAARRCMNDDEVPTFASTGSLPTIKEIQYPLGRVIFNTAAGSGDTITCATGHYLTISQFLGCLNFQLNKGWQTEVYQHLRDMVPSTALTYKKWDASVQAHAMFTQATYTSSGGNAHSHFTLTHEPGGTAGNDISIQLIDPAGTSALSISVVGKAIAVTLAYATGAITTTAKQLVTALGKSDAVLALGVTAKVKTGETGAGIVAAITPHEHLSGGLNSTDYSTEDDKVVAIFYVNYDTGSRHVGFGIIEKFDPQIAANTLVKTGLTFRNYGPSPLYYAPA